MTGKGGRIRDFFQAGDIFEVSVHPTAARHTHPCYIHGKDNRLDCCGENNCEGNSRINQWTGAPQATVPLPVLPTVADVAGNNAAPKYQAFTHTHGRGTADYQGSATRAKPSRAPQVKTVNKITPEAKPEAARSSAPACIVKEKNARTRKFSF